MILGNTNLGFTSTTYSKSSVSSSELQLAPAADYFLIRDLSLGLALGYDEKKTHGSDPSASDLKLTTISAALRAGYNIPVGRTLSIYTLGAFGVASVKPDFGSSQSTGTSTSARSALLLSAEADVLLLFHPTEHFFVGGGPYVLRYAATNSDDAGLELSRVGAALVVGGYVDTVRKEPAPTPAETETAESQPTGPHFGQKRSIVLSNELGLGGSLTFLPGDVTQAATLVQPSIDWFVLEHFSIGGAATLGHSTTKDSSQTREVVNVGAAFRVGGDLPLARYLSLYPRASVGAGVAQVTSGSKTSASDVTLGLYAPIMFHAAPHFFVGLGPSVSTEVAKAGDTSGSSDFKGTTIGVGLTVGGWL